MLGMPVLNHLPVGQIMGRKRHRGFTLTALKSSGGNPISTAVYNFPASFDQDGKHEPNFLFCPIPHLGIYSAVLPAVE
jgi:hypothetical protein